MSVFSHYPLQKGILTALTADNMLMGMITGIFDRVEEGQEYPYITFADISGADWSTKTTSGMECSVNLHIWSREGGKKEALLIMERVHDLLHDGNITVSGQSLVLSRFSTANVMLESDGIMYRGSMRFRILLQAN